MGYDNPDVTRLIFILFVKPQGNTRRAGRAEGGSFKRAKLYAKERICLQNVRRAINQCDAQTEMFLCASLYQLLRLPEK